MAICFGCWKLIKIDDVQPKNLFHFTRRRYVDRLVPSDLMINHWDKECDKPKLILEKQGLYKELGDDSKKKSHQMHVLPG